MPEAARTTAPPAAAPMRRLTLVPSSGPSPVDAAAAARTAESSAVRRYRLVRLHREAQMRAAGAGPRGMGMRSRLED